MPKNPSDSLDDSASDINIYSFIIRVWKEEPAQDGDQDVWRGHITPIPDGIRQYFIGFDEIPAFIQDYLGTLK